jgi:radical SAM protein with 4Fe4S-binding SPASM domain
MSFSKLFLDSNHELQAKGDISNKFYTTYLKSIDQSLIKKVQLRLSQKDQPATTTDFCSGLFTNMAIDYKGNILPCISFRKMVLGSVFSTQSIRNILISSEALQKLRSLKKTDLKSCGDCRFINECAFCLGMMHTRNNDATKPMLQYCEYHEALVTHQCQE